jgi:hypothetical protein
MKIAKRVRSLSIICCMIALLYLSSCSNTVQIIKNATEKLNTTDYISLGVESSMDVVAENDKYKLLFNPQNCTVAVFVKETGYIWKSNANPDELGDVESVDVKNQFMSQLILSYYDDREKNFDLSNYDQSITKNQFKIYGIKNGVGVSFSIGDNGGNLLMPGVISETTMKKEILSKLDSDDAQLILKYYVNTVYSSLNDVDRGNIEAKYPLIKKEPIYLAKNVNYNIKKKVIELLQKAGITTKSMIAEYKKIGFKSDSKVGACFTIPIEYTLSDDGLRINIPVDKINYDKTDYRITKLSVLPYFGISKETDNGYMFIPDGCGSLIDLKTDSKSAVSLPVYGRDYSLQQIGDVNNYQQAVLPVYGLKRNNNGFVAVIGEGDPIATIICQPKNSTYNRSSVYSSFNILSRESYSSNDMLASAVMVKYGKKSYDGDLSINYRFLTGDKASYTGMALSIQNYLFKDKKKLDADQMQMYVDTYGLVSRKERFMGYPITAQRALTTYEQSQQILTKLSQKGIKNITLRYLNWSVDKYNNSVSKIGNTPDVLGSKNGMKDLVAYTKEKNIRFFADSETMLQKANNYFQQLNCAQMVDGGVSKVIPSGIISQISNTDAYTLSILKPSQFKKAVSSVENAYRTLGINNISLSSLGDKLYTDFNSKEPSLRNQVAADITTAVKNLSKSKKIIVEKGNMYVLPYVSDVLNIEISDSRLVVESDSVPFLQIVLHGYLNYVSDSINLSDDPQISYLKAIEYGCGLKYTLNYADPSILRNTNYSSLYSTSYQYWLENASDNYKKAAAVLDGLQNKIITNHFSPMQNVYVTEYENGIYIVVNYRSESVTYKNQTVKPKNFVQGKK